MNWNLVWGLLIGWVILPLGGIAVLTFIYLAHDWWWVGLIAFLIWFCHWAPAHVVIK